MHTVRSCGTENVATVDRRRDKRLSDILHVALLLIRGNRLDYRTVDFLGKWSSRSVRGHILGALNHPSSARNPR